MLLGCLAIVTMGGYLTWDHFNSAPEAPAPSTTKSTAAKGTVPGSNKPAATASVAPNQTANPPTGEGKPLQPNSVLQGQSSAISRPIAKTEDVLATRHANGLDSVDPVVDPADPSRVGTTFIPRETTPIQPNSNSPTGSYTAVAPGLSGSNRDVTASPKASNAFKRYVGDMLIKGIFQGTHPRAHINGRIISAGDTVDRALGIVFECIDAEKKTITFRDGTGATVTRRY